MENNLTPIVGGKKEPSAFAVIVMDMSEDMYYHVQNQQQLAHLRRALFLAYKDEGFSSEQPLELLKSEL